MPKAGEAGSCVECFKRYQSRRVSLSVNNQSPMTFKIPYMVVNRKLAFSQCVHA